MVNSNYTGSPKKLRGSNIFKVLTNDQFGQQNPPKLQLLFPYFLKQLFHKTICNVSNAAYTGMAKRKSSIMGDTLTKLKTYSQGWVSNKEVSTSLILAPLLTRRLWRWQVSKSFQSINVMNRHSLVMINRFNWVCEHYFSKVEFKNPVS